MDVYKGGVANGGDDPGGPLPMASPAAGPRGIDEETGAWISKSPGKVSAGSVAILYRL
jgi:hypothetical protein